MRTPVKTGARIYTLQAEGKREKSFFLVWQFNQRKNGMR